MTHETEIDLFENIPALPEKVQEIINRYCENDDYFGIEKMDKFLSELEELGYTFEFGLDMIPFGLKEITFRQYCVDTLLDFGGDYFDDNGETMEKIAKESDSEVYERVKYLQKYYEEDFDERSGMVLDNIEYLKNHFPTQNEFKTTYTIDIGPSFGKIENFESIEAAKDFIKTEIKIIKEKDIPKDSIVYWENIYKNTKIYKVETRETLSVIL